MFLGLGEASGILRLPKSAHTSVQYLISPAKFGPPYSVQYLIGPLYSVQYLIGPPYSVQYLIGPPYSVQYLTAHPIVSSI